MKIGFDRRASPSHWGVATRVATAMRRAGLRTILLKGPAVEEWLYPHRGTTELWRRQKVE